MIKFLHTADLHLDAPFAALSPEDQLAEPESTQKDRACNAEVDKFLALVDAGASQEDQDTQENVMVAAMWVRLAEIMGAEHETPPRPESDEPTESCVSSDEPTEKAAGTRRGHKRGCNMKGRRGCRGRPGRRGHRGKFPH